MRGSLWHGRYTTANIRGDPMAGAKALSYGASSTRRPRRSEEETMPIG